MSDTLISDQMIRFESIRSRYNDYSRLEFRFKPRYEGGMKMDIYVRNTRTTDKRTYTIVIWEGAAAWDFFTYQAMFISLICSVICCICILKMCKVTLSSLCGCCSIPFSHSSDRRANNRDENERERDRPMNRNRELRF